MRPFLKSKEMALAAINDRIEALPKSERDKALEMLFLPPDGTRLMLARNVVRSRVARLASVPA